MTGLLVSVRSAAEAEVALAGGADVIDVKEPRRGALGAADPQVWSDVLHVVGDAAITSAALGELMVDSIRDYAAQTAGFRYVKIGLSHWQPGGPAEWIAIRKMVPQAVSLVPVIYADAAIAGCRSLSTLAAFATSLASAAGSPLILIDTLQKQGCTLLDFASESELESLIWSASACKIGVALAGSLNERAIEKLLPLAPAYVGVRGAACTGGRDGTIDLARVKSLAQLVHGECRTAAF
jgi:uncharacterized protein (UPF0264 family)